MDRSDKVNIVTGLVNSYIRQDNEVLADICARLVRENEKLKARVDEEMHLRMEAEMQQDATDAVAREYFINNAPARLRWAAFVAYDDDEYNRAIERNMMFGDEVDWTPDLRIGSDEELTDEDIDMIINM